MKTKQNNISSRYSSRINPHYDEAMKRSQMPIAPSPSSTAMPVHQGNNPVMQDLLWISKQQQQHPSTHAHPLKNTIRVSSNGIRHKFDGKQWRPLCESMDGYECRNLAFRSSLCQKHFYKLHLFKRPYVKNGPIPLPSENPSHSLKRPLTHTYEYHGEEEGENTYDHDDDSIQFLENNHNVNNIRNDLKKVFLIILVDDKQRR
jgi:hypothetical protein